MNISLTAGDASEPAVDTCCLMGRARRDVKGISMKQGFFLKAYGMLWRVLIPFLRRNKRLADGWEERRVPVDWLAHVPWAMRERRGCDVWLQAASGGEARLALAVLEALPERASGTDARDKAWRVLLITWTRQGRDVLEAGVARIGALRRDMLCAVRFAPLDEPARRALDLADPRVLALLETELWPGLMAACRETGVPLAVLNGRMTNTSYECYRVLRNVLRDMPPRRVLAMCGEDLSRFCGIFDGAGNPPCRLELIPISSWIWRSTLWTEHARALRSLCRKWLAAGTCGFCSEQLPWPCSPQPANRRKIGSAPEFWSFAGKILPASLCLRPGICTGWKRGEAVFMIWEFPVCSHPR